MKRGKRWRQTALLQSGQVFARSAAASIFFFSVPISAELTSLDKLRMVPGTKRGRYGRPLFVVLISAFAAFSRIRLFRQNMLQICEEVFGGPRLPASGGAEGDQGSSWPRW